ncbi:MAG: hypothetical protein AB1921_11615 [Thermodesulfobacteriota bacterium]
MRTARRGKKKTRLWLYGILLAALFVELFTFAWCRFQCVRMGYEVARTWEERKSLLERQEILRAELSHLKSPPRIMQIGETLLGLSVPTPAQVVVLDESQG